MKFKLKKSTPLKSLTLGLAILFIVATVYFGSTFFNLARSGKKLFVIVANGQTQQLPAALDSWQKSFLKLKNRIGFFPGIKSTVKKIDIFNQALPQLVGLNQDRVYLVLLQNPTEIRPSGGFMGSYAKIKFSHGVVKNIQVQDIYVPDGQIQGHVQPPEPIQTAFGQGWWRLRDSNWHPDFPTAAQQIDWFFQKGGESQHDGVVAINLNVVKDLVDIYGPLTLPDYDYKVDASNLTYLAQTEAEVDFFPGSTQKKDFLSALTKQLIFKIKSPKPKQVYQSLKLLAKSLEENQVLIWVRNDAVARLIDQMDYNGEVERKLATTNHQLADYLYIVDANLGANKANCCTHRQASQKLEFGNGQLKTQLQIKYKNTSHVKNPQPPFFWGGPYKNYLRILVPEQAQIDSVAINQALLSPQEIKASTDKDKMLKTIGFWVEVPPLSISSVEVNYSQPLPIDSDFSYSLQIQKQPGITTYPHTIIVPEKEFEKKLEITKNEIIKFNF